MGETLHRTYTHNTEMHRILRDAGIDNSKLMTAYDRFHDIFDICKSSGRSINKRKASLSHVKEAFKLGHTSGLLSRIHQR